MADERDFDAGVDERHVLAGQSLLHGGHDAEVGPWEVLAAVDRHRVQRPLSLQRHPHRQQQVPSVHNRTTEQSYISDSAPRGPMTSSGKSRFKHTPQCRISADPR